MKKLLALLLCTVIGCATVPPHEPIVEIGVKTSVYHQLNNSTDTQYDARFLFLVAHHSRELPSKRIKVKDIGLKLCKGCRYAVLEDLAAEIDKQNTRNAYRSGTLSLPGPLHLDQTIETSKVYQWIREASAERIVF